MKLVNSNSRHHPDLSEPLQFESCAKNLGVSPSLLQQAVLETGSLNKKILKKYLIKKGFVFSVLFFSRYIKQVLLKHSF
jgi:hypothetical protein